MSEQTHFTTEPAIASSNVLDNLDDDLKTEFWDIVIQIESTYVTYRGDPDTIPAEIREGLDGIMPEDYEIELAKACIIGALPYPDVEGAITDQVKRTLDDLREIAFEHALIASERADSEAQHKTPEFSDEFKADIKTELYSLADTYAAKLAKESDRSIGQVFHELSTRRVREDLSDMMGGIATILSDECDQLGATKEQRDQLIEQALQDVTDRVIGSMADARLREYEKISPTRKYLYAKWEEWNGQGFKGKLKKGLAFGFAGAGMGVVIAPIAGAVAGAGIIGAATAVSTRSLLRGLASSHLDNKADAPRRADKQNEEIIHALTMFRTSRDVNNSSIDKPPLARGASTKELLGVIDKNVEKYRKRNRNRVLGGTAIAMSAGLISGTLADWMTQSAFASSPASSERVSARTNLQGTGRQDMGPANHIDNLERQDMGPAVSDSSHGEVRQDMGPAIDVHSQNIAGPSGRGEMFSGYHGSRQLTPEGQKAIFKDLSGYRIKPGENLWSLSEQALEAKGITNPTVYEIDATKDLLLDHLQANGSVGKTGELIAGTRLSIH